MRRSPAVWLILIRCAAICQPELCERLAIAQIAASAPAVLAQLDRRGLLQTLIFDAQRVLPQEIPECRWTMSCADRAF